MICGFVSHEFSLLRPVFGVHVPWMCPGGLELDTQASIGRIVR